MKNEGAPQTLGYFVADTEPEYAHSFSGPIFGERDEERIRRIYQPGTRHITQLTINWYSRDDSLTEVINVEGICSICRKEAELPYETPNDPPFFPASDGNRHCESCERWLTTGEIDDRQE